MSSGDVPCDFPDLCKDIREKYRLLATGINVLPESEKKNQLKMMYTLQTFQDIDNISFDLPSMLVLATLHKEDFQKLSNVYMLIRELPESPEKRALADLCLQYTTEHKLKLHQVGLGYLKLKATFDKLDDSLVKFSDDMAHLNDQSDINLIDVTSVTEEEIDSLKFPQADKIGAASELNSETQTYLTHLLEKIRSILLWQHNMLWTGTISEFSDADLYKFFTVHIKKHGTSIDKTQPLTLCQMLHLCDLDKLGKELAYEMPTESVGNINSKPLEQSTYINLCYHNNDNLYKIQNDKLLTLSLYRKHLYSGNLNMFSVACPVEKTDNIFKALEDLLSENMDYHQQLKTIDDVYGFITVFENLQMSFMS